MTAARAAAALEAVRVRAPPWPGATGVAAAEVAEAGKVPEGAARGGGGAAAYSREERCRRASRVEEAVSQWREMVSDAGAMASVAGSRDTSTYGIKGGGKGKTRAKGLLFSHPVAE